MPRNVFFSFHYEPDHWRAATVRNIGKILGNQPAADNDWENVARSGEAAIEKWIADQMKGRSCTVVLIGSNTANRKWINHEIVKSWDSGMGIVGIHIHGLKHNDGLTSTKGADPFSHITHGPTKRPLSTIVKCYNPSGTSQQVYAWISENLEAAVEEAIQIRQKNR